MNRRSPPNLMQSKTSTMPIKILHWFLLVLGMGLATFDTSGQEPSDAASAARSKSDASVFAVLFNEQHVV